MKMSSRHVLNTSSRRLQDEQMFAGMDFNWKPYFFKTSWNFFYHPYLSKIKIWNIIWIARSNNAGQFIEVAFKETFRSISSTTNTDETTNSRLQLPK